MNESLADRRQAPSQGHETLYRRWARSGCGLLVTGNVVVDPRHLSEPRNVVLDDDRSLDVFSTWAAAGREAGAAVWMQLNHPGRQANPLASRGAPVAPSALRVQAPGARTPKALSQLQIEDIIGKFATAASLAIRAGFDGVQLHAAHGFLISQFLSPLSNRRLDAWGQDLEGRMRFLIQTTRALRVAVGTDHALSVKLNSADFQHGGFGPEESETVVQRLAAEGVDLVEISGGNFEAPAMVGPKQRPSTAAREAYFLEYASQVLESAGAARIAVTGGFRSVSAMQEAVGSGACHVVGLGRPLCLHPEGGSELLSGSQTQISAGKVRATMPRPFGHSRALESAIDIQWHTDQIHRLASGLDPDPGRPPWRTAGSMTLRSLRGLLDRYAPEGRGVRTITPAAGRLISTRLYDPIAAIGLRQGPWRRKLIDRAAARSPGPGGP